MVTALALAVGVGFLAGAGIALNRLVDLPGRPARDLSEAHRAAQTWGFIGLFVIGMALRLMPLLLRTRLRLSLLIPVVWLAAVGGVMSIVAVRPLLSESGRESVDFLAAGALLLASICFLAVTAATFASRTRAARRPPWAFPAGACLLVLAACLRFAPAADASDAYRFWTRNAEALVLLGGFAPAFIVSVAARGFRRRGWREGRFALLLTACTAAAAAGLTYLDYGGQVEAAIRLTGLAFLALAAAWCAIVPLSGVMDAAALRTGATSLPHLWLVRSAFAWLIAAAAIGAWIGLEALLAADLPASARLDAILHALAMTAVILICGMGLLLLPGFARSPLHTRPSGLLAGVLLLLLNGAALLRVLAPFVPAEAAETRAAFQAVAGGLAEAALILFVIALLRASLRGRGLPADGLPNGPPSPEPNGIGA